VSCSAAELLAWCDDFNKKPTTSEADRRAVIAQAYYGCYHMYSNGIGSVIPERNAGKHEQLIQAGLSHVAPNAGKKQKPKIESNLESLDRLRKSRGKAQYELAEEISRAKMQQCIDDAHQIIDNLFNVGAWVAQIPQGERAIPRR
jgi:hypothetical protein